MKYTHKHLLSAFIFFTLVACDSIQDGSNDSGAGQSSSAVGRPMAGALGGSAVDDPLSVSGPGRDMARTLSAGMVISAGMPSGAGMPVASIESDEDATAGRASRLPDTAVSGGATPAGSPSRPGMTSDVGRPMNGGEATADATMVVGGMSSGVDATGQGSGADATGGTPTSDEAGQGSGADATGGASASEDAGAMPGVDPDHDASVGGAGSDNGSAVDDDGMEQGQICDATFPNNTVGIQICRPNSSPGYTLFHPMPGEITYLIDALGRVVHQWLGTARPGLSVELLPDGRLVRTRNLGRENMSIQAGGAAGSIEIVDWDGNVQWRYQYSNDDHRTHHDFEVLPNGNLLMIAWNVHRGEEVTGVGRRPELIDNSGAIWSDEILELRPVGEDDAEIVWRWRAWDHLVQDESEEKPNFGQIADHPRRININTGRANRDWLHINAVDYHPELELIALSVRALNEIWIIDKSTTTAEAASSSGGRYGRGGDLLYRWGNPGIYGAPGEQQLFGQHDAQWIKPGHPGAGHLLVYNNGDAAADRGYSTVDELVLPELRLGGFDLEPGRAFAPDAPVWTYQQDDFFSRRISGAQRLPNGNTLICEGSSGHLFEVTPNGEVVWDYINPVGRRGEITAQGTPLPDNPGNPVFRAARYPLDYPAFDGRNLVPGPPIEAP
ncbi:MAG: aryl-sulfate sulfotransferase [Myxococcota bacterium]|nr:aryl-sulfate sulfotransferase [Myxococcota bacterium]